MFLSPCRKKKIKYKIQSTKQKPFSLNIQCWNDFMILLALDRAKVKGLGKKQGLGLGKKYIFEVEFLLEKIWLYHCLYI